MKAYATLLALALILALPVSGVARESRVLEDAREVSPSMLTLPSTLDGTLAIQGCGSCQRISLKLARTARFFVGRTEVTYLDLQRHLRTFPQNAVLVVSPIGQKVVTRIQASDAVAR